MTTTVYVGTYTRPDGRAEGIYRLTLDEERGQLAVRAVHGGVMNPSYLAVTRDGTRLYCVQETMTFEGEAGGAVSAFAVAEAGLVPLGTRRTHGGAPCHVAISPEEGLLTVANYMGGSLSVHPIGSDGALGEAMLIQHTGSGPNPQRQTAPHVHSSRFTPDGRGVIVMDLGTDRVTTYPARKQQVETAPMAVAEAAGGDGPRMSAYNARDGVLYVLSEMGNNIALFACDAQGVPARRVGAVSTLPEGVPSVGTASDVHLSGDGRFLYASNRGHDSLSVYAVAAGTGALAMVQNVPSGGRTPRGFGLSPSGRWLLCGNQESDTLVVFAVDRETGKLARHGECAVPSPVCVVFSPA